MNKRKYEMTKKLEYQDQINTEFRPFIAVFFYFFTCYSV